MSSNICTIFRLQNGLIKFLGKMYHEEYRYSELTWEDSDYRDTFQPIEEFLDNDRHCSITLFTSRSVANDYITKQKKAGDTMFVMEFDKLCSYMDKNIK